jgi:hypothetical protein
MKTFLGKFGVIAASFAATAASATAATAPAIQTIEQIDASLVDANKFQAANESGDLMNFTLRRAGANGPLFAQHESHASHASHASHHSHYSGN